MRPVKDYHVQMRFPLELQECSGGQWDSQVTFLPLLMHAVSHCARHNTTFTVHSERQKARRRPPGCFVSGNRTFVLNLKNSSSRVHMLRNKVVKFSSSSYCMSENNGSREKHYDISHGGDRQNLLILSTHICDNAPERPPITTRGCEMMRYFTLN